MRRHARLDTSRTLHHVMVRGLERRVFFRHDGNRAGFVARHLVTEFGLPLAQAARHLGVSTTAISKLLPRMGA